MLAGIFGNELQLRLLDLNWKRWSSSRSLESVLIREAAWNRDFRASRSVARRVSDWTAVNSAHNRSGQARTMLRRSALATRLFQKQISEFRLHPIPTQTLGDQAKRLLHITRCNAWAQFKVNKLRNFQLRKSSNFTQSVVHLDFDIKSRAKRSKMKSQKIKFLNFWRLRFISYDVQNNW